MALQSNFLESDPSILESNLKIIKDETEEEFQSIFGGDLQERPNGEFKIVRPNPGICIKCFKTNTNEKFFINLCQTDAIPAPENISGDKLAEILNSDAPSSYKIPMSISDPRITTDKSGNQVDACDIAISPEFFQKCMKELLFRDFLIAIISEALSDKYNVQIKSDNWIVLKNRKFIGNLVMHRIQNRDKQNVKESYNKVQKKNTKNVTKKKLIQELTPNDLNSLKTDENISNSIKDLISGIPEYRFIGILKNSKVNEILAEFFLPKCISVNEIALGIGEDRVLLESTKHGYLFDKFIDYNIEQDKVTAKFDKASKMLQINIPIIED